MTQDASLTVGTRVRVPSLFRGDGQIVLVWQRDVARPQAEDNVYVRENSTALIYVTTRARVQPLAAA